MQWGWIQSLILGMVLGWVFAPRAPEWLRQCGLERKNYLGRSVATAGGVLFAAGAVLAFFQRPRVGDLILLLPIGGFALLGLVDDLWGSAEARGLRGHLLALLRRRVTTGTVKLIGGLLLAWWVAGFLSPGLWRLPAAVLIALCANTINLLDLRPLRALKGFWVGMLLMPGVADVWQHSSILPFFAGLTLPYAGEEGRRKVMLGDTGSNLLGGLLGACAVVLCPWWGQLGAIVALGLFHLWAEKHSLTAWIARHSWARWLDELGAGK